MAYADFKCEQCGAIFTVTRRSAKEGFIVEQCPECTNKESFIRLWDVPNTDVAQGLHGNGANGMTQGVTYHPSKYGKYSGTRVK